MTRLFKKYKKLIIAAFILGVVSMVAIVLSNVWILRVGTPKIYTNVQKTPQNDIGLVLGTVKTLKNGRINLYFKYRVDAAAKLYHAGKIKHIIVSGDNHRHGYNEPEDMQQALIKRGVPESKITLDFAGFRTFDSMIRCQKVFQRNKVTVISQAFHNYRALFIAKYLGMNAIAFNAKTLNVRTIAIYREYLARFKAVLDLYILNTKPRFLGKKITIDV